MLKASRTRIVHLATVIVLCQIHVPLPYPQFDTVLIIGVCQDFLRGCTFSSKS